MPARRPRRRRTRTPPPPPSPYSSALAARLAELPHSVLAELCATACILGATDSSRAADAALARHNPTPRWAVEGVICSPDLSPRFMGVLTSADGAAAAVCRAWRDAWDAVWKARRVLRPAPLAQPNFDLWRPRALTALPDGERLCIATEGRLHITDRQMRWLQTLSSPATEDDAFAAIKDLATSDEEEVVVFDHICAIAASDDGIYVAEATEHADEDEEAEEVIEISVRLRRLCPDSLAVLAEYDLPDGAQYTFAELALVQAGPDRPGGCLRREPGCFAVASTPNSLSEIVALDALTLKPRHAFGRSLFPNGGARGLAAIGQELFVGDAHRRCLHVFSLGGEHLREVCGDWGVPRSLCFVDDRLYLVESGTLDVEGSGRRIVVLTPGGVTLQTYRLEVAVPAGSAEWLTCHFDGRLLAASSGAPRLLALQGL